MRSTKNVFLSIGLAVSICCCAAIASAATLEIQLIDVDIEYDSTSGEVSSLGPGADPLSGIFFFIDEAPAGALVDPPEDISVEITVPGVFGIDPTGDIVMSGPGGSLKLLTPGLALDLDLGEVEVVYTPVALGPDEFQFVFLGAISDLVSQALPFGLEIGDMVSVTVSTQTDSLTTSTTEVEAFTASGTGELLGDLVPEPGTACLLAIAGFSLLAGRPRS